MRFICLWFGFFALAFALSSSAAPQLSRDEGNNLAEKIVAINRNAAVRPVPPKRTRVTEPEVNAYLAFNLRQKIPRGLTDPQIRISPDGLFSGLVLVDMDDVRRERSSGGIIDPLSYVSGQVPLTARGVLRTRDGQGQFQLLAAEMNGVPLPKAIVQELVTFFSRTPENPAGFNLDAPFRLPAKIREILTGESKAIIVQ